MDFFSGLEDIGGAVSDLLGASGTQKAAKATRAAGVAYGQAATIALQNKDITLRSGNIQQQQEDQGIIQAIGSEKASVAGAGFDTGAGSAGDLLRMSTQKGALNKQLLANQTEITAQGFEQQANAYKGQQNSAEMEAQAQEDAANAQKAGGAAKGIMGVIQTVGTIASLFSDRRLKKDITLLRKQGEFNIYSFRYIGNDKTVWEGVMADEVEAIRPEAVTTLLGFKAVNYGMLGLEMVEHGR